MSEIPKAYEPQSVEDKWYDFWVKQGCFTADPARVTDKRPAFSIVIPPPNVTGMLHMGHVLNNTIQDILSRKARMDGKEVLWLPGTDHAGIATQVQVEKTLKKEERLTKYDLGREKFLERVWQWKEKHGGIIINQLKKLGCSCDWTRERFTMDPEYSRCVQKVFVELYKKGLIYRGKRMVNWCPVSQTALSDEEVEMKPQKGFMYHFKVEAVEADGSPVKVAGGRPLTPALSPEGGEGVGSAHAKDSLTPGANPLSNSGGEGQGEGAARASGPQIDSEGRVWLTIATTRPETIPGDTAVAVNPNDPRYAHLIGKHIIRPLPIQLPPEQKLIPIIGDEHVDFEFGTGVLKVTPAHDKADFEIGQRHQLPIVDIMNANGTMNDLAGESLVGLDRFEARKVAVERLKELAVMIEEKPYENNVGFSQRADVPIEPRLSEQWFLKYPAVAQSKACVEQSDSGGASSASPTSSLSQSAAELRPANDGKMRFHPPRWAKVYDHWLSNIQDWCISRQLWWGHRIPVWTLPLHVQADGVVEKLKAYFIEWDLTEEVFIEVETAEPNYGDEIRFLTSAEKAVAATAKLNSFYQHGKFDPSLQEGFPTPRAKELAKAIMDGPAAGQATQDPDVLDTWFSSWLWPFATMGWPENTETLKKFYPTTDLVTGPDIIFFWVARMIMAGYEYMGDAKFALPDAMPFRNVYFTGIIRDKQGRKMSKTLGNSPDPLDLISKYGADALRFGTMRSAPLGQDVLFDEKDVELGRNFCNKLWNACRFRQMVGPAGSAIEGEIDPALLTSDDKWILLRLDQAIGEVSDALTSYNFSTAVQALYRFFWSEYCDWYVEASKAAFGRMTPEASPSPLGGERAGVRGADESSVSRIQEAPPHPDPLPPVGRGGEGIATDVIAGSAALRANKLAVMDFVLGHTLRLFHPFLPFITEELWQGMGFNKELPENQGGNTIMFAPWPKRFTDEEKAYFTLDDAADKIAAAKYELVSLGRNLRRELKLDPAKKLKFIFQPAGTIAANEIEVLRLLLNAESMEVTANYAPPKGTPSTTNLLGELFLPLEGVLDVAAERTRLQKDLEKFKIEIEKVEQKLANPAFTQKVPPAVLAEHQKRLADWQARQQQVQSSLDNLG